MLSLPANQPCHIKLKRQHNQGIIWSNLSSINMCVYIFTIPLWASMIAQVAFILGQKVFIISAYHYNIFFMGLRFKRGALSGPIATAQEVRIALRKQIFGVDLFIGMIIPKCGAPSLYYFFLKKIKNYLFNLNLQPQIVKF